MNRIAFFQFMVERYDFIFGIHLSLVDVKSMIDRLLRCYFDAASADDAAVGGRSLGMNTSRGPY